MHGGVQRTVSAVRLVGLMAFIAVSASACASIRSFPNDPAKWPDLAQYFGPGSEAAYNRAATDDLRRAARNRIVRLRLEAYDQTYSEFIRRLESEDNTVSAGGSLAVLTLGGLAATSGNAATAAALAAAGAGIVGAQGVISKDLYFQRTLPALLAEMDASRARIIYAILTGLGEPVTTYPLAKADVDLDLLRVCPGTLLLAA